MRDLAAVVVILASFVAREVGLLLVDLADRMDPDPPQPVPLTAEVQS